MSVLLGLGRLAGFVLLVLVQYYGTLGSAAAPCAHAAGGSREAGNVYS